MKFFNKIGIRAGFCVLSLCLIGATIMAVLPDKAVSTPDGASNLENVRTREAQAAKERDHMMPFDPNQACKTYIRELESVDVSNTPPSFQAVFNSYIQAWKNALPHLAEAADARTSIFVRSDIVLYGGTDEMADQLKSFKPMVEDDLALRKQLADIRKTLLNHNLH